MKEWIIYDYQNAEINWDKVLVLTIEEYPWYTSGKKQETKVQIAIANDVIHIQAKAQDDYIRAVSRNLNDPVHLDSCFEFFVTPWAEGSEERNNKAYFNIEINCIGTLYMAARDGINERVCIDEERAKLIVRKPSLNQDNINYQAGEWELKVEIPLALLEEMSGKAIQKEEWFGNFYRCGGSEDDQYACWNPIVFKEPSFHQPAQFGKLIISKDVPN